MLTRKAIQNIISCQKPIPGNTVYLVYQEVFSRFGLRNLGWTISEASGVNLDLADFYGLQDEFDITSPVAACQYLDQKIRETKQEFRQNPAYVTLARQENHKHWNRKEDRQQQKCLRLIHEFCIFQLPDDPIPKEENGISIASNEWSMAVYGQLTLQLVLRYSHKNSELDQWEYKDPELILEPAPYFQKTMQSANMALENVSVPTN